MKTDIQFYNYQTDYINYIYPTITIVVNSYKKWKERNKIKASTDLRL